METPIKKSHLFQIQTLEVKPTIRKLSPSRSVDEINPYKNLFQKGSLSNLIGAFNPFEKYESKMGSSSPRLGMKIKNI